MASGRYLITGQGGQLANEFERSLGAHSLEFLSLDITRLDITDFTSLLKTVKEYRPSVIINCAAYNLVDMAEKDFETAYKVNVLGPKLLALAAKKCGSRLVHYSSDYVFDGLKESGAYTEGDAVNPLNEYGKTKLMGEKMVLEEISDALVFRLSWVYGEGQQNFIYKLLQWEKTSEYLRIACDEFSVPTHTAMVADATIKALDVGLSGLYHLTNSGFCSRYEWACFIFKTLGINKHIHPVSMSVFNLPAKRPLFSAMNNQSYASALNIEIPSWQESVQRFLSGNT